MYTLKLLNDIFLKNKLQPIQFIRDKDDYIIRLDIFKKNALYLLDFCNKTDIIRLYTILNPKNITINNPKNIHYMTYYIINYYLNHN